MFTSVQFKTEFCTQAQATIVPRVTMTQFLLMILSAGGGAMILNLPGFLIPIPVILAYIAGYFHNGELVIKRVKAWITVWFLQLINQQTQIKLENQWKQVKVSTELKQRS